MNILEKSSVVPSIRLVSCLAALAVLGGIATEAAAVVLYDVNFEAPTHVLNQLPTVGFGALPRNTPTRVNFGQPMIRTQAGVLDNQFCRFEATYGGALTYCQLEFGLDSQQGQINQQYPFYRMRFDAVVQYLGDGVGSYGTFHVFADNPTAHQIIFTRDNDIKVMVSGDDGYSQTIGTYQDNSRFAVQLDCDHSEEVWSFFVDGIHVFSGAYPVYYGQMRSLRFNLQSSSLTACVDIDNVKIEGLPEPATLGLAVLGSLMALGRRRPRPVVSK